MPPPLGKIPKKIPFFFVGSVPNDDDEEEEHDEDDREDNGGYPCIILGFSL